MAYIASDVLSYLCNFAIVCDVIINSNYYGDCSCQLVASCYSNVCIDIEVYAQLIYLKHFHHRSKNLDNSITVWSSSHASCSTTLLIKSTDFAKGQNISRNSYSCKNPIGLVLPSPPVPNWKKSIIIIITKNQCV